jgi:hypothetical protein
MSGRAHLGYAGDPRVPMTEHQGSLRLGVVEALVRVSVYGWTISQRPAVLTWLPG